MENNTAAEMILVGISWEIKQILDGSLRLDHAKCVILVEMVEMHIIFNSEHYLLLMSVKTAFDLIRRLFVSLSQRTLKKLTAL